MLGLVLLLTGPPESLGHDRWDVRESAERRFRLAGPLAWPLLLPLAESEDAEARSRAARLLLPYRAACGELRAAQWLADPFPPSTAAGVAYFGDHLTRTRAYRQARAAGVPDHIARYLLPECEEWDWFRAFHPPQDVFLHAMRECKTYLGRRCGWPFDSELVEVIDP
jgi:hypothetical protein